MNQIQNRGYIKHSGIEYVVWIVFCGILLLLYVVMYSMNVEQYK